MATITLTYDARNVIAKKTVDYIMSLGVFKREKLSGLDKALLDVKEGRVYDAESVEDLKKKCSGNK